MGEIKVLLSSSFIHKKAKNYIRINIYTETITRRIKPSIYCPERHDALRDGSIFAVLIFMRTNNLIRLDNICMDGAEKSQQKDPDLAPQVTLSRFLPGTRLRGRRDAPLIVLTREQLLG